MWITTKESPHSQIFAVCRYFGCVTGETDGRLKEQAVWYFGPCGWLLGDYVQLIEPVACTGARGLWTFEEKPDVFAKLREVFARSKEASKTSDRDWTAGARIGES